MTVIENRVRPSTYTEKRRSTDTWERESEKGRGEKEQPNNLENLKPKVKWTATWANPGQILETSLVYEAWLVLNRTEPGKGWFLNQLKGYWCPIKPLLSLYKWRYGSLLSSKK